MPGVDPLTTLMRLDGVAAAADAATAAIARTHRRPAGLRQPEVISSESCLRGARAVVGMATGKIPEVSAAGEGAMTAMTGQGLRTAQEGPLAEAISAYSLLSPPQIDRSVRTFARSPLQLLARADVAAGGRAAPHSPADAQVLQALGRLITKGSGVDFDRLLPVVVQAEILAGGAFGERTLLLSFVAARLAAQHTGFDPRGFAIPEVYAHRKQAELQAAVAGYREAPERLYVLLFQAWEAGAKEADGIARAL